MGPPVLHATLLLALCLATPAVGSEVKDKPPDRTWQFESYLDIGYGASSTRPANGIWRTKGTTFEIDDLRVNMAEVAIRKEASAASRWGIEFGLQAGVDTLSLLAPAPPAAGPPIEDADTLRHVYRANATYLFPNGRHGIRATLGLINSYIGYESYHAFDNPNYTRAYMLDAVPYFMVGLELRYSAGDALSLGSYAVNGWDYLAESNGSTPSLGQQLSWRASPRITFTQNFYYGPEQQDTSLDFWRFFSNSIFEWKTDTLLVAAAVDFGTQRQSDLPDQPRTEWGAAAIWVRWRFAKSFSLAFRPEIYRDDDGFMTGAAQTIRAATTTLRFDTSPGRRHRLAFVLEYRHDRSTGPEGGFFEGPDNQLVPDQRLLLGAVMWKFEL